jgi:hypothetical protein
MRKNVIDIQYLGFRIKNTGNSDGNVLFNDKEGSPFWQCHLGNYGSVMDAKRSALFFFMLNRPEDFGRNIHRRTMYGSALCHEWYTLKKVCEREGIEIPEEITCSPDPANSTIYFNGQPFGQWEKYKEHTP